MFFERYSGKETAVLVHPEMFYASEQEDPQEFKELVKAAGVKEQEFIVSSGQKINPKFFLGKGKLEEVKRSLLLHKAEVVLINYTLSPSQERNLERELKCRVIDRTGLILDIFAQKARSYEGKLQVELAQLEHLKTRLVRGWTHLERQKGGIGLRGPGETQLETDRRLLQARIKSIKTRLNKVLSQRQQSRSARKKAGIPLVSLVGYTNAGKSTLFNALTCTEVFAADQLFATLDTTVRRFNLPQFGSVLIGDTVGFIRHLPHQLIQAFKATLEESVNADLLLHVIDCNASNREGNIEQVQDVLSQIGAAGIKQIEVFNKQDLLANASPKIERDQMGNPRRVWLSAKEKSGLDMLCNVIRDALSEDCFKGVVVIPHNLARLRARLHDVAAVQCESELGENTWKMHVQLAKKVWYDILKGEKLNYVIHQEEGKDYIQFIQDEEKG